MSRQRRHHLSVFPCLTPAEFEHGARALVEGLSRSHCTAHPWRLADDANGENPFVVVKKSLCHNEGQAQQAAVSNVEDDRDAEEFEQLDDEENVLLRPVTAAEASVEYHIHYHRAYEVPALYFFLRHLPHCQCLPTLEQAYEYLVPDNWRATLEGIGVMGAISMTENPVTSEPCFFVHPCNTVDAMSQLGANGRIDNAETYLRLWLGVVGAPVGLHLPLESG